MKKNLLALFIAFPFILLLSHNPASGETDRLKVALAHWPPWKIIRKGIFQGIDVDIMKELGTRLDITFVFIECPWKRCIELVKKGDADIITSFGRTTEREEFVYYLGPPYYEGNVVFYRKKGKPFSVQRYEDLKNLKIGVVKGSAYFNAFDNDPGLSRVDVAKDHQLPQMLLSERIDLIAGWEKPMDYFIISGGFRDCFEKMPYSVSNLESYIAISKRSKKQKRSSEMAFEIGRMIEEGAITDIMERFFRELPVSKGGE